MSKGLFWIIVSGVFIGLASLFLVALGNPQNMGFCVACFERDISGALGFHRTEVAQYLRPEIIGIVLGALIAALFSREFNSQGGSSSLIRFVIAVLVMIGALVFLGCPLRMILRMSGGDLNAYIGLLGFIAGIILGVFFLKRGFNLGAAKPQPVSQGIVLPVIMTGLLLLLIFNPVFNINGSGALFFSQKGPGSMHAPLLFSLVLGLIVGFLAQRSRLCLAGGIRDIFLINSGSLIIGFVVIFLVTLAGNCILGKFKLSLVNQPIAHTNGLFNFLGLFVVGLGSTFLGGCPLRQLILTGSGNTDSALTVLGMIVGAAVAHNFMLAASPQGVSVFGQVFIVVGIIIFIIIGFDYSRKT